MPTKLAGTKFTLSDDFSVNRSVVSMASPVSVHAFGAKGDGATDDTAAIQTAINSVVAAGGGVIRFPAGTYNTSSQVTITGNKVVLQGEGDSTSIVYVGSSQIDALIYANSDATEGWGIVDMRLAGGAYQLGKVKWVVHAERFHRGCILRRLTIREGLGLLRLAACYYGKVDQVQCVQSVPNPATQGWSLADWQEVYGAQTAPVYFGGNGGGFQADRLTVSKVGSEAHTANTGAHVVLFDTASATINSMTLETSGVAYDTFAPTTTNLLSVRSAWVAFNQLYFEHVGAVSRGIYAYGRAQVVLNQPWLYRFTGGASSMLLCNDSTHQFVCNDMEAYRINALRFARVESNNGGTAQDFVFTNPTVATGERTTDGAVNAGEENVYDTFGQVNLLGLSESNFPALNPRDSVFPQVNTGLAVTASSDGNGHYVQVSAGVFFTDRATVVSNKLPTKLLPLTNVVYRLRPTTASKYYRLFVGYAGNLYLTQSDSAFSDDRGGWLAQFETDGSTAITSLAANPRLALRGTYTNGRALFRADAAPVSGAWIVGDTLFYNGASAGGNIGMTCTAAGTPGTWKTFGAVAA
jgi:hypothetical protein